MYVANCEVLMVDGFHVEHVMVVVVALLLMLPDVIALLNESFIILED